MNNIDIKMLHTIPGTCIDILIYVNTGIHLFSNIIMLCSKNIQIFTCI